MNKKEFKFNSEEGTLIHTYVFEPDIKPIGMIQIVHGMVETAERYERFAKALTNQGYLVYASDLRGHGKTAGDVSKIGYLADKDGFEWIVKDVYQLTNIMKDNHPNFKTYLFGHSMGSFVSQRYIELYGNSLDGVILCGSNGPSPMFKIGKLIAKTKLKKHHPKDQADDLNKLVFGSYNNKFLPARTDFDWLSRDEKEVDKYIDNPYCGKVCSYQFYYDFMDGLSKVFKKENVAKVPKTLPILIISGSKDPVGENGKGIKKLRNMYQTFGIKDIQLIIYDEARHELLNEINRDEVTNDIINWVKKH